MVLSLEEDGFLFRRLVLFGLCEEEVEESAEGRFGKSLREGLSRCKKKIR